MRRGVFLSLALLLFLTGCNMEYFLIPSREDCQYIDPDAIPPDARKVLKEMLIAEGSSFEGSHKIVRFPCGTIYIHDETNCPFLDDLLGEIEKIINAGEERVNLKKIDSVSKAQIIIHPKAPDEWVCSALYFRGDVCCEVERREIHVTPFVKGEYIAWLVHSLISINKFSTYYWLIRES